MTLFVIRDQALSALTKEQEEHNVNEAEFYSESESSSEEEENKKETSSKPKRKKKKGTKNADYHKKRAEYLEL